MRRLLVIITLFCLGCTSNTSQVSITVQAQNKGILVKGLPADMLYQLNRDTTPGRWYAIVPVFKMPADADMIDDQPEQPGTYTVNADNLLFEPDTAFNKGETYFLRFYHIDKGSTLWRMAAKTKQRPGTHTHTDVIFKH